MLLYDKFDANAGVVPYCTLGSPLDVTQGVNDKKLSYITLGAISVGGIQTITCLLNYS